MAQGFTIFAVAFVAFVIITLLMGVRQVPQGYAYTVERFGKYYKTLYPGLGIIVPYIDRIGRKMNMMEQVLDVPTQEVITKDNATVAVDGVMFFQVLDAARASYEVHQLENALLNLTMTNIRTVMGSMDLDALLSHRDEINTRLLMVIDSAAQPWGIKTNRVEIKDIVPPRDLIDSMGRQMKAEREKRAAILDAEGHRQAEILRAEGKKAALILDAEGRRESAFRDAEARERSAEAEATATRMMSVAIAEGDPAAVNYFIAEKYVKALDALAHSPNQKTLIMPMEMGGLAGTLAGVAQVARDAFQDGGSSNAVAQQRRNPVVPPTRQT
jgi:regulator of protease activity HflC (stomatin/prohibitin superfamily)